jgi:hypothetical protein
VYKRQCPAITINTTKPERLLVFKMDAVFESLFFQNNTQWSSDDSI